MANNNNATPNTSSDSKDSRWYFTAEQLANSPSRRQGINADQELSYRQLTAYLIQEMGQRLSVSQLCINTAIVYMHRFYAFHSFTHFHRNGIAAASLFLAAKVEEQPRKLEHVIKVAHLCLSTEFPHASSEMYNEQAQDLVFNENVLLQTLGFDVAIDHPHTHVVKTCHLVKGEACKDLAQTSYFLASNSLHLTSMCLQYRPTVVACFCIYLACKWSRWEIPQSTEGKHWFHYVDTSVTLDLLKQLTDEFLAIYEKSPARLKSKLNSIKALAQSARMNEPQRPIADANGSNTQLPSESARRSESYSSHHRHHSSSGSHHNHHSKSQLSSAESLDHGKSTSSHKQPYPTSSSGSSHSGRQSRPERSDRSQPMIPESQIHQPHIGSNKQPVALPGVQRPSISNRPPPPHGMPMPPGTSGSSQRLPHTPHDPNYHKSRSSMSASINPAIVSGHKSLPKDPQRSLLKDPLGRPIDPNKISSKHSTSGMGSTSNSSNPNLYPAANLSASGVDLTRNPQPIAQHPLQRPFGQSSSNAQPPPFNQPLPNRSNNSNSIKYEQSVQQQMHLQSGQKQSLESSFSQQQINPRQVDESSNIKVEQMEICSPTKYPPSQQSASSLAQQALPNNQAPPIAPVNKASSIFSPEWSDKVPSHPGLSSNMGIKANNDSLERPPGLGINIKTNRDSPKKSERDRRSETPKKEKNRSDQLLADPNKMLQPPDKRSNSKKFSDSSNLQIVQNSSSILPAYDMKNQQALNLSGLKRPSETIGRVDDEREYKVRKVESQSPQKMPGDQRQYQFDQSSMLDTSRSSKSAFSTTVNGIETDPDLVRNLLKESLCTENKFSIKSDNALEYTDIKPIEPIRDMETLPVQLLQNESPVKETIKEESVVIPTPAEINEVASGDQYSKSKAEKKKKKDKHKHKEKDKSKDKEERKKHKKDKERSKERERSSGNEQEQNHVKLTIPKEKLNLTSLTANTPLTTSELKIKIPKDRIRADYQVDDNVNTMSQQPLAPPAQPSSLKIKISKDKIESYSHHSQHHSTSSYGGSGSSSHHSHHSNKKKDRDRDRDKDRDKDKKRSSNSSSDHNKQNGSGSGGPGNTGMPESSAATKSQSSNPSKMQNYSTNMSQLFGDLNDDDDSPSPPSPSSYQQSQIQHRYSHLDKYGNQYQQQIGNYYHNQNKQ